MTSDYAVRATTQEFEEIQVAQNLQLLADFGMHMVVFRVEFGELVCMREPLLANGIAVPPITRPGYMPSGSMSLRDPDGYVVDIHHWSGAEHQAWLKNVEEKKKSGVLHANQERPR